MSANEGGLEKETDLNNEDELKHKGSVKYIIRHITATLIGKDYKIL